MSITPTVKAILANYESDNPGTKGNIARMLMQGRLGGTGKMQKTKLRELLKDYKLPGA